MEFIWDEQKNGTNMVKHGFDFADAEFVFQSKLLVRPDSRKEYGEDRYQGIGKIKDVTVVVIFTERKAYEEALNAL